MLRIIVYSVNSKRNLATSHIGWKSNRFSGDLRRFPEGSRLVKGSQTVSPSVPGLRVISNATAPAGLVGRHTAKPNILGRFLQPERPSRELSHALPPIFSLPSEKPCAWYGIKLDSSRSGVPLDLERASNHRFGVFLPCRHLPASFSDSHCNMAANLPLERLLLPCQQPRA